MKIAFVGKGGSGKSTLAALFVRQLLKNKVSVLAVDADINIHLADLLGLECNDTKPFSDPKTTEFIRTYLRGENLRLESTASFVKTTPPAGGSNLFTIDPRNPVIRDCTLGFAPGAFYGFVGTYTTDDIGATCYHGHLAVLENLLSHSNLSQDEWMVVDMVAGIDAFANTLHAQFDAIVLVMEPTPEGILVYKQYSNLAKEAGVLDRLVVVVNKVEGVDDLKYVESQIGNVFFGQVSRNLQIKKDRQYGKSISLDSLGSDDELFFNALFDHTKNFYKLPNEQLKKLIDLHLKFCQVDWVRASYGDLSGQVDLDFRFK
jgi:CO dehydrogenase maturation factor